VVCFLAGATDFLSIQHIRPALDTSSLLFSGCCESFPSVGAADHLSLFFAEVTDECSCNHECPECLHGA